MYNPIQLTYTPSQEQKRREEELMRQFSLDIFPKYISEELSYIDDSIFTETVFNNGRELMQPIVIQIGKIKDLLDSEINNEGGEFDPNKFWKSILFKELEDKLQEIFGFRSVEIFPTIDKYDPVTKKFISSKAPECYMTYHSRFLIDGLLTDNGFYDSTHSFGLAIYISLQFFKMFTSEEIVACLLHEFGHGIDPALVDIKYTQVNILSKYMTDRQDDLTAGEKKYINSCKFYEFIITGIMIRFSSGIGFFKSLWTKIKDFFTSEEEKEREKERQRIQMQEEKIVKIKEIIRNDMIFNRQNFSEAFADNFARMYGFGSHLASTIRKASILYDEIFKSRIKKESARQEAILNIIEKTLNHEHRTDLHRIRSILREYELDLRNPRIPNRIKNDIMTDKLELEKILDQYLNNFSEFENRINSIINEELKNIEKKL